MTIVLMTKYIQYLVAFQVCGISPSQSVWISTTSFCGPHCHGQKMEFLPTNCGLASPDIVGKQKQSFAALHPSHILDSTLFESDSAAKGQ